MVLGAPILEHIRVATPDSVKILLGAGQVENYCFLLAHKNVSVKS